MSGIFSKVLAGGLSAGVFLLWWPAHVSTTGNEWLFVRGILWSLAFELLLLAYRPLEQAIARAVRERRPRTLGSRRVVRILTLAALAVAVPAVMLAGSHPPAPATARAAAPKVVVKREIVRREVVVRRVNHIVRVPVTTAPPAPAAATPAASSRTTTTPASATSRTETRAKVTSTASQETAKATTTAPAATTPSTAPAPTSATKQPTTASTGTAAGTTEATPAVTAAPTAGAKR